MPTICPLCSKDDPAAWTYNLASLLFTAQINTKLFFYTVSCVYVRERGFQEDMEFSFQDACNKEAHKEGSDDAF